MSTFDLTGDRAIPQGSFWSIQLLYPGNVAQSTFRGQIRNRFGGDLLATLRFAEPDYNQESDRTLITVFLRSSDSEKIPVPVAPALWVYDILMRPAGEDGRRILRGRVDVSPGVTQ